MVEVETRTVVGTGHQAGNQPGSSRQVAGPVVHFPFSIQVTLKSHVFGIGRSEKSRFARLHHHLRRAVQTGRERHIEDFIPAQPPNVHFLESGESRGWSGLVVDQELEPYRHVGKLDLEIGAAERHVVGIVQRDDGEIHQVEQVHVFAPFRIGVVIPCHQTEHHVHPRHRRHQHGPLHLAHVRLVTGLSQGGVFDRLQVAWRRGGDRQGRFEAVLGIVAGGGAAIESRVIRIEFPLAVRGCVLKRSGCVGVKKPSRVSGRQGGPILPVEQHAQIGLQAAVCHVHLQR